MADQEMHQTPLHVVMFPWLAHGHIYPFLQLAKGLDDNGLRISFVSTPLNLARIKQQILQTRIQLVELPMPAVDGLPKGVESTADLSKIGGLGLIPLLFQAIDRLEKPFEALLKRLSPDFVINDIVQHWTPRVSAKLGIPSVTFLVLSAASTGYGHGHSSYQNPTAKDLTIPPPGFPSTAVRRLLFEAQKVMHLYRKEENDGCRTFMDRRSICFEECWAIACNTCVELEEVFIEHLHTTTRRPLFPVGILMPDLPLRPAVDRCLAWLDRQPAHSVLLASFGSECNLTNEEIDALAAGIEESGVPFLWVLPVPDATLVLPQGFEDRTQGRGLVVTEWAPQLHILDHPSTAAFLTHCGWNSVTEGLRFAVPFVALPMQFEQGLSARHIAEELKVGEEIRRNEENGIFRKEDVSKAVVAVMVGDESRVIRSTIEKISRDLTCNNSDVCRSNIKNFICQLEKKASNK